MDHMIEALHRHKRKLNQFPDGHHELSHSVSDTRAQVNNPVKVENKLIHNDPHGTTTPVANLLKAARK